MRGLVLFGDTERSAAMRHEIPISIIDPLLFAEAGGRKYVLASAFEHARIKQALHQVELLDYFALGYRELAQRGMSLAAAAREVEARALQQIGIDEALVPGDFPLALGDRLREGGIVVTVDEAA